MKTIFIGDIHGRTSWDIIVRNNKTADKIIFIGDYFDSFTYYRDEQVENFKKILQFQSENKDRVHLLIGNHDLHYFDIQERYSGYQDFAFDIIAILKVHRHLLEVCYQTKDFIAVHAGITKTFLKRVGIEFDENLSRNLRELFMDTPKKFGFKGTNMFGDDITQGPMWVREKSLCKDMIPITQIVGHTHGKNIRLLQGIAPVYIIDALESRYYLVHENDKFTIKQF